MAVEAARPSQRPTVVPRGDARHQLLAEVKRHAMRLLEKSPRAVELAKSLQKRVGR
jgi:hypothetical protein